MREGEAGFQRHRVARVAPGDTRVGTLESAITPDPFQTPRDGAAVVLESAITPRPVPDSPG